MIFSTLAIYRDSDLPRTCTDVERELGAEDAPRRDLKGTGATSARAATRLTALSGDLSLPCEACLLAGYFAFAISGLPRAGRSWMRRLPPECALPASWRPTQ